MCEVQILNRNYVLGPFHGLISTCQNNVLLGLRLVETVETFPRPTDEEKQLFEIAFGGVSDDLVQSKARFKRWVLLNGFRDINQCVGTTLQRLITFKTIEAEIKLNPTLNIEAREGVLRRELGRLHTPELIEKTNLLCAAPLMFQKEIESFNLARNCLEHAVGTVAKRFCKNPEKDKLTIFGRRFKLFFKQGEKESPALLGKPGPENAALMLGAEDFEIQFAVGQPIDLSLKQFLDVLSTCVFVRADIEQKLAA
jgi:hypothetical protein